MVKVCNNCKNQNPDDAEFCASCGEKLINAKPSIKPPKIVCSKCKNVSTNLWPNEFCQICGSSLDSKVNQALPEKTFEAVIQKTQNLDLRQPEDNVYHNFPEWLEWLKESGLDISQFTSEDLSSISSHRISFPQFCRRLERRLDDPEGFRKQLENR